MNRPLAAVIFHRFGPYHVARLLAVAGRLRLLAIEQSAETAEYAWDEVGGRESFERLTLIGRGERLSGSAAGEIARRLRAALDQHRPAVVAIPGWSDPAALAALDWGLSRSVPIIMMSESTEFDEPRRPWKEWVKSRLVRLCTAGFAGGTPHKEYLEKLGLSSKQIFVGYDAVDNAHFTSGAQAARAEGAELRARLELPEHYFLASSRFVEQKNLPMLLQGFASYHRAAGSRAWKLVLLGDGPLWSRLLELRCSLGLSEAVLLPGFKQYDDLPAYYGLAGAFVHVSNREPWGLVVNEALAAGLPVIVSSRCGCARDLVVSGKNGYLCDPADDRDLAAKMTAIAESSTERLANMGETGRRMVAGWSPDVFAENLQRAAEAARMHPLPKHGWFDRLLIRGLIRRANKQARRLLPAAS